jgi:hypothetical protein
VQKQKVQVLPAQHQLNLVKLQVVAVVHAAAVCVVASAAAVWVSLETLTSNFFNQTLG